MRKRLFAIMVVLALSIVVLPVSASACGGFVAIKGEKFFHSVCCKELSGREINSLRWFDTSEKAQASGLIICESCANYSDWYFECKYDTYWITDDPLILTALEHEYEIGWETGYESAYDDFQADFGYFDETDEYIIGYNYGYHAGHEDAILNEKEEIARNLRLETGKDSEKEYNAMDEIIARNRERDVKAAEDQIQLNAERDAYYSGYDNGYEDGFTDGLDEGEKTGYDQGYTAGKSAGHSEGYQIGFHDGEDSKEWSNFAELLLLLVPCMTAFFFGKHRKQTDLENDLKKCRLENIELSESLKDQNDAAYILKMIARKAGTTTTALAESLFINFRKSMGYSEEAAREELQKEKQNWPQSK